MPADYPKGTFDSRGEGTSPTGTVGLRHFDQGVVETLGAVVVGDNYYLTAHEKLRPGLVIPDGPMRPTPGKTGIPVTFAYPDETYEHWRMPCIVIRRDDLTPAMQRWHPGAQQYRAPAPGALPITVTDGRRTVSGWDRYEQLPQAVPFDITYTISIMARYRGIGVNQPVGEVLDGTASPKAQANALLDHVMRVYQPYSKVIVRDSIGDLRSYEAFMEAMSHLDQVAEVTDRVIGFAVTVRVEAELDLNDPVTYRTVYGTRTVREEKL